MKLANVTALASAVGIALVGAGMSSSLEASSPGSDLVAQAGQTDSATGRYIITFSEQGLVAYKGDVAGLARTAPDDRLVMSGASRKFDANSSAARAYKAFLESKRAEHITAIEMHRITTDALVFLAAEAKDASLTSPGDPALRERSDQLAAQATLHASRAACDAADRAVQVFGGRGYLEAFRPGRHFQDTRVARLYEGTDEILTLKIAAAVLGKDYAAFQ